MKVKDIQFIRHLLTQEISTCPSAIEDLLEYDIQIQGTGDSDNIIDRGNCFVYSNPSSVTRFLFQTSYTLLSKFVPDPVQKDRLSLLLLPMCKSYVYHDDSHDIPDSPVIISHSKMMVTSFIVRELLEPLIGRIKNPKLIYMPCNFTDVCKVYDGQLDFSEQYNLPNHLVKSHHFPAVVCNLNIKNKAARDADLLVRILELSLGRKCAESAIKSLLLNQDKTVMAYLVDMLYTFSGKPEYVHDFLNYIDSYTCLSKQEQETAVVIQFEILANNAHMKDAVKLASQVNTETSNQWSQWSLLVGLTEKQLGGMRGNMWPASENLKPIEDKRKKIILETAQKKNKTQLNYEELLEVSRDIWQQNAVEPGKLIDHFLANERVWH